VRNTKSLHSPLPEVGLGGAEWVPTFSLSRLKRDLAARSDAVARIQPVDLNCVFYLYPDESSAKSGLKVGGSGFWVALPSYKVPNYYWLYAVSNKHVVHKNGATVIRANARSGGIHTFSSEPTDWIEHPNGHDVAILPMVYSKVVPFIDLVTVPPELFALQQHIGDQTIGIGDDVYMIGRFINHEGRERNLPSVRFGNISMLPGEPIYVDKDTKPQESFAVELRSMCGYSGSPVYVEIGGIQRKAGQTSMSPGRKLFLGVHWGHIIEPWTVQKHIVKAVQPAALKPGEIEIEQVSANTGMNGVVPAWRLKEMFDLPKIKEIQRLDEQSELERRNRDIPGATFDSASTDISAVASSVSDDDANPNHLADFTRLVDVAVRKRPQGDQT
jgi:hypothetical protein